MTGASSGIGAATARHLAGLGARVALSGRDALALARVADGLPGAVCIAGDLTGSGAATSVVADAVAALGGLDIVVSNAGSGWAGPFQDMTAADIDAVLDVDLRAGVHLVHAALPHLLAAGRGRLVVVGSIAGLLPVRGEAVYSVAKAGLAALVEALGAELAGTGVTVSLVSPGVVDTAFFDRRNRPYARSHPRPIPPERVARAIAHCAMSGAQGRTVPGWLALPVRIRAVAPRLYRRLQARFG